MGPTFRNTAVGLTSLCFKKPFCVLKNPRATHGQPLIQRLSSSDKLDFARLQLVELGFEGHCRITSDLFNTQYSYRTRRLAAPYPAGAGSVESRAARWRSSTTPRRPPW